MTGLGGRLQAAALVLAGALLSVPAAGQPVAMVSLTLEAVASSAAKVDVPVGQAVVYERHDLDWRVGIVVRSVEGRQAELEIFAVRGVAGHYRLGRLLQRETAIVGLPIVVTVDDGSIELSVTGVHPESGDLSSGDRCGIACEPFYAEACSVSMSCGSCGG